MVDRIRYEPCSICGDPMIISPECRHHNPLDCALLLRRQLRELRAELALTTVVEVEDIDTEPTRRERPPMPPRESE